MFSNKHFFGKFMNGLLIVNKEKGYTSRDVVNIVSKILNTKKIGHTGTLDPIAEGVLVLTVGSCTKLSDVLISEYKEYIAEFVLGYLTDTLDSTGTIICKKNINVTNEEIKKVILSFKTKYEQTVPKYSAVKVKGKKLYEYARNNIDIKLPKRLVEIKDIEILNIDKSIKIRCLVSKGTYIRSLIKDIGDKLNTYATMISLTRIKQGEFDIKDSYKIDDIKNGNYHMLTIEEIFKDYPKINLSLDEYKKVSNGNLLDNKYNSKYVKLYYKENLIAIYKEYEKSKIKPLILI